MLKCYIAAQEEKGAEEARYLATKNLQQNCIRNKFTEP